MTCIYTAYSKEADITFIMEDTDRTTSVKGFYYGEPDEEATKEYYGNLTAIFPDDSNMMGAECNDESSKN